MKSYRFKFLFAYRNIIANIKNSLVIILTLSLVFCLTILLFGMKTTFSKVFEYQALNDYQQIDVVMTYDEYSSSKFINKRSVVEEYDDSIYYAMSFFNLDVLTETDSLYYTSMISGLSHEFEYLIDQDVLIKENEVIITESYSQDYGLKIGDTITFYILDKELVYTVGDILEDRGLFSGLTFYLDKEELMTEVYGFSLTNFGNILYIDLNEGYDIEEFIETLKSDSNLNDYYIYPAIDWEYIEVKAMDTVSIMLALGLIILLAVVLVLDSLFPIISKDITPQQGVVNILGGDKSFIWHVFLIQWIIYIIISYVLGLILSLLVTNLGLRAYGVSGFIPPAYLNSLLALVSIFIYISIRAYISYKREFIKSSVELSKNKRYKLYTTKRLYMLIAFIILILEYTFKFFSSIQIHALIIVILSLYLTFNIISYIVVLVSKLIRKKKKQTLFSLFQMKYLEKNKHLHQSFRVLVICLVSIVLLFSVRSFQKTETDRFYNIMRYDISIFNITDYDSALLDEVRDNYDVQDVNEAILYEDVNITFSNGEIEPINFFVSLDFNDKEKYFDIEMLDFDETYKNSQTPYVLLPLSFELIYGLEIGDIVTLDLNYALEDVEFEIAGFLNTNVDKVIYSNFINVSNFQELAKPNTIFINTNNKTIVYNNLIKDYSNRMYYIMDPDIYFDDLLESIENISNFFTVFTLFMILCFVVVIFNNTILIFYSLKNDLAKIKVLGADKKIFIKSLTKEFLLLITIILIIGMLEIKILSKYLKYIVLFTNYYKNISSTLFTEIYGCAIVFIVFLLSYLFYYFKIKKLPIINEIKFY